MVAGIVPPATPGIGTREFAWPTQVEVDRRGVKPTNHASLNSSVVPVLPAAGQPMFAFVPVPAWMFLRRISVASAVTPSSKARVRWGLERSSHLPVSLKQTFVTALGRLRQPPDAIVAYALAISSGETPRSSPPRPSAG